MIRRPGVLGAVFLGKVGRAKSPKTAVGAAVCVWSLMVVSCTPVADLTESSNAAGFELTTTSSVSVGTPLHTDQILFDQEAGVGSFSFDGYGPYPNVPIEVFYFAPDSDLRDRQILVVMPGRGRNADEYRDDWLDAARKEGAILVVPEFPNDVYSSSDYNLGHVVDDSGDVVSESEWTFAVVEGLFDHVFGAVASRQDGYFLYGHSAGGQFVHRFMLFMANNRVIRAVSANSGWYTVTDPTIGFPYGLRDGPQEDDAAIAKMFAQPLTVLLGSEDIDPDADGLRSDSGSDDQGATRFDRGFHFFRTGQLIAEEMGTTFAWKLEIVNGVGHSNADMVDEAAEALFHGEAG